MTYTVDGRQYIAAMVGQVLWAFALGYKWRAFTSLILLSDSGIAVPLSLRHLR